jgi:hypothetical protein
MTMPDALRVAHTLSYANPDKLSDGVAGFAKAVGWHAELCEAQGSPKRKLTALKPSRLTLTRTCVPLW